MTTGISYLDEVWNPITGCSGKGCKVHCWAREIVRRFPALHGSGISCNLKYVTPFSTVQFHPDRLDKPLHWKRPRRVGVCFMGDLFDEGVGILWHAQIYSVIRQCPQHQFFILTKQAERMRDELEGGQPLPNVWHGVSLTDQQDADRMIPELLKVPGKRWVSIEPMLGPVDLSPYLPVDTIGGVEMEPWPSWIVLGCESGPKRRPCDPQWMIDVVRQCKVAGVPVYVKQVDMGKRVSHNPEEWPEELRVREKP